MKTACALVLLFAVSSVCSKRSLLQGCPITAADIAALDTSGINEACSKLKHTLLQAAELKQTLLQAEQAVVALSQQKIRVQGSFELDAPTFFLSNLDFFLLSCRWIGEPS